MPSLFGNVGSLRYLCKLKTNKKDKNNYEETL